MEAKFLFAFCVYFCPLITDTVAVSDTDKFASYVESFGKGYEIGSVEYGTRFENFKKSLERQRKLNSLSRNPYDAVYGVTKFSDMSEEEFATTVLSHSPSEGVDDTNDSHMASHLVSPAATGDVPKSYDLRKNEWPVLTPVKNQKECGGCWAFSIAENMETQFALQKKTLYSLSMQELIDCTKGGSGCHGGNICGTASWLNTTRLKLTTEKEYPFIAKTGSCKTKSVHGKVGIDDYSCDSFVGNESSMVSLIATHGPLAVAVDATSWQDYLGGIIQHHCSGGDNHAVQVIGYDQTGPVPYYIVRNSWGKDWGLDGYLRIKIGDNLCGVAEEVVTVSV